MDARGIILELQWKKKYAVKNGGDDVSNIGVCYMAEPSVDLDWISFKSYLCQNVGTKDDVTFAYVDSEGDEIPIESECEFQEALKFARQRARRGRAIVLKLDRPHCSDTSSSSSNMERPPLSAPAKTPKNQKNGTVPQCEAKKDVKPHVHPSGKTFVPAGKAKSIVEGAGGSAQRKKGKVVHSEGTRDDSSPAWFEKEKEKMKNEIVDQITSEMAREMQKYADDMETTLQLLDGLCLINNVDGKKKKRKKVSDRVLVDVDPRDRRLAVEGKGIVMEFEWKKKYEVKGRGGDPSTIGVCFMPDPSPHLEWKNFKTFLRESTGIEEESTLAYEDRDGNEIPIENVCDFEKALKFARQRSHEGGSMIFKLDRPPDCVQPPTDISSGKLPVDVGGKTTKPGIKNEMQKNEKPSNANPSTEKVKSTVTVQQTKTKMVRSEDTRDDSPPVWFGKEKDKMKNEIVSEVTSQIKHEFQQAVAEMKKTLQASDRTRSVGTVETTSAKRMKKKVSDEESSDANAVEQREYKLLKKIEKLQKREKKLERKLDSKLEKLENRTKRMLEKKSHSKSRSEPVNEQSVSNRKRTDVPVGTYLMDAILLNGGSKLDTHIKLGESFTKVWQIMNTGTLPWTDKTELRLAWGTTGLEPQVTTVKCPALEPGERGQICVTFKAPEFAGTFESYWHFYHMGVRFGHWISCAVIVEPKEETETAFNDCDVRSATDNHSEDFDTKSRNDHAVDLTIRSKSEDSDLEVITNFEKDHENCGDAEYESDSDSDNLSVISNELSMSSESDEDKFVVVSLPPSSATEGKFLGSGDANIGAQSYPELVAGTMTAAAAVSDDTVTSTITTDKSSSAAAMLASNVSTATCLTPTTTDIESAHGRDYNKASVEVKPSTGASDEKVNDLTHGPEAAPETDFIKSQLEVEAQSLSQNAAADQPLFDLNHSMKNNGNLNNIVFAVDILGRAVPVKLTNKPRKQNSNTPSPHSSGSYPDVCPVSVEDSEEIQPNPNNISSDHGNDLRSENASNYTENSGNIIHILPETLMNGAVNVATSAISTARAVISNLRTIPSRTSNSSGWETGSPADSSHPSVTSQSMAILLDMGFTNKELNLTLLKRNNNDISKVVSELLSHAEDNSTTI